MGYTHYIQKVGYLDAKGYAKAYRKIQTLLKNPELANLLADSSSEGRIDINGIGENGHENLLIPKDPAKLEVFSFCKTARKPYDLAVVACLCILGQVEGIKVTSDGYVHEWKDGAAIAGAPVPADILPTPSIAL